VLKRLDATLQGLTESDAQGRLEKFGANSVAHEATKSIPAQLLQRMINPLNILLLALATVLW